MSVPVSVLVQTKNEEVSLPSCLASLEAFDEVIVVDSRSSDRTREIALDFGCKVVEFDWNGKYPKKKQWQLENVETLNSWVMFLDADERVPDQLGDEIRSAVTRNDKFVAYDIELGYVFSGQLLRHGHKVVKRCLIYRDHVHFPVVEDLELPGMGELEGHYQPIADGRTRRLRTRLIHEDEDPVSTWFARHNRYSDWEAHLHHHSAARTGVRRARSRSGKFFHRLPGKPLGFFIYSYLVRLGFLDGRGGFEYALALSFYYWQIELKKRELTRKYSLAHGGRQKCAL